MEFQVLFTTIAFSLILLAYQYRDNRLALFVILIFANGYFGYLGKSVLNIYKIVTLSFSIYLVLNENVFVVMSLRLKQIIVFFLLFIASILFSSFFINDESIALTFSQVNRFLIPMLLFLVFRKRLITNRNSLHLLNKLFFKLIVLQIFFSVLKIVLLESMESIVGSIASQGGAIATSFPLLALLWLGLNTNMKLNRKRNLFIAALLVIGYASGKRAIWFMFPIIFIFYGLYVVKKVNLRNYGFLLILAPLFFYFGLRLIPTLNPEEKTWGSFDVEYAYDYVMFYSFGKKNITGVRPEGAGRGGALLLLGEKMFTEVSKNSLFGYGLSYIYAADVDLYRDSNYYFGVNHKGSLTGIFQLYIAIGLIGILPFLVYYFLMFTHVKYRRLAIMFMLLAFFDFILYAGTIVREPALSVFFVFMIFYANLKYDANGNFLPTKKLK